MATKPAYGRKDGRKGPRSDAQKEHWAKVQEDRKRLNEQLRELQAKEKALQEEAGSDGDEPSSPPPPPAKKQKGGSAEAISGLEEAIAEAVSRALQKHGAPGAQHEGTSSGGGTRAIPPPIEQVEIPTTAPPDSAGEPQRVKPIDPTRRPEQEDKQEPLGVAPPALSIVNATKAARTIARFYPANAAEGRARIEQLVGIAQSLLSSTDNAKALQNAIQRVPGALQGASGPGSQKEADLDKALFGL